MIPNLNPLKNLAGKLNHFKLQKPHVCKVYQLANIVRNAPLINKSQSTLDSISLNQITELKRERSEINKKQYYKMRLALDVASNPKYPIPITTIYEPLPQSQKQIISIITRFVSTKLDSRQTLYLNQKMRSLINGQYLDWDKLHLHEEAPYRRDISQMPVLSKVALRQQVRCCNKKTIITKVSQINQQMGKAGGAKPVQQTEKGKKK